MSEPPWIWGGDDSDIKQSIHFNVYPSTADLLQRKTAAAGTSRDSGHVVRHVKGDIL